MPLPVATTADSLLCTVVALIALSVQARGFRAMAEIILGPRIMTNISLLDDSIESSKSNRPQNDIGNR